MNKRLLLPLLLTLCLATALQAAVSFVQGEQASAALMTSVSKAFDSNNTAGNTIIMVGGACMTSLIANDFGITDTRGNTYILVNDGQVGGGTCFASGSSLFYAEPIAAGANTVTATNFPPSPVVADLDMVITELAGGTGGLDQSPTAYTCTSGCTTTFNGPAITITKTETLIATAYDKHSAHSWSINSGWTICAKCVTSNSDGETLALAYHLNAAAGTYTPTWTYTGSTSSGTVALTASFFPSSTSSYVRHKAKLY